MQSFAAADDEDRDDVASLNGSSDNDPDETMEDADGLDADVDAEAEAENDEDNEDNEEEDEDQDEPHNQISESPTRSQPRSRAPSRPAASVHSPSQPNLSTSSQESASIAASQPGPTSHPNPTVLLTAPSPPKAPVTLPSTPIFRPILRPEALTASVYDIVPTVAAPHSTSINAVTSTPDLRWVFSGGQDGYIRKFNWPDTVNGKTLLTVAQRHPFVDSVTKAGVLMSYWENDEPQSRNPTQQAADDGSSISSVYSLAVHNQGLWLLSGLESGGINLQSVRHDEGKRITCLRKHTSAVSVLTLAHDERSVLSGSWDKNIYDWDLNTGSVKRAFKGNGSQISALEPRPSSSLPVPEESGDVVLTNGTLSTNNDAKPLTNGVVTNGLKGEDSSISNPAGNGAEDHQASPNDSLFGDGDSLFGDNDDAGVEAPSGGNYGDADEDDEFSRAIHSGLQQQEEEEEAEANVSMADAGGPIQPTETVETQPSPAPVQAVQDIDRSNGALIEAPPPLTNGLPHSEEAIISEFHREHAVASSRNAPDTEASSDSTFLAASIDGNLRVWDRRQQNPVARISPRNVPPWCMNACWSPDGNYIYAGRRNGSVEEYSLHKGLGSPERTFKFPQGSGPVSAVRAMPNGRHLIW
ncbi:MAG: Transcription factor spt8 [Candelina mexicana]|nr:MAG: Transcription factor spt8 [Candelina mexicana]